MMLYCFRRSQFTKENIVSYFPDEWILLSITFDVLMLLNSLDMGPKQHFVGSASFEDHIIKELTLSYSLHVMLERGSGCKRDTHNRHPLPPLRNCQTANRLRNLLLAQSHAWTNLAKVASLFWFIWTHYKLLNPKNYWMNEPQFVFFSIRGKLKRGKSKFHANWSILKPSNGL